MTPSSPTETVSKKAVRRAGEALRKDKLLNDIEFDDAMQVLSGWRSMHLRPINTLQALVRKKIKDLDIKHAIVAQRIKRAPSIITKLKRFPNMCLDRMQDIGGIRAVVSSVEEANRLHETLAGGRHNHYPVIPPDDYILQPKSDGYRGIHQVFKYYSRSQKYAPLNGLQVEIQIRTKLQHCWATAVETLGVIEKSSFKTGRGDEKFKRFFCLSSALFSMREKQPIVESLKDKTPKEIVEEFELLEKELSIFDKLQAFSLVINGVTGIKKAKNVGFYIIMLNADTRNVSFLTFTAYQADIAEQVYTMLEKKEKSNPSVDVVLASAADMKDLKIAYPNYFADTKHFCNNLQSICKEISHSEN